MTAGSVHCPDWAALVETSALDGGDQEAADALAEMDAALAGSSLSMDPPPRERRVLSEWQAALEHTSHCRDCREAALVAEPTVLFQRLPQVELSAEEVATMGERVAGVLRGRRVASDSGFTGELRRAVTARRALPSVAAAAALLLAVVLGSFTAGWQPEAAAAGLTPQEEARLDAILDARPLVEGLDVFTSDDSEQTILMQGAVDTLDFAWVADGALEP